MKDVLDKIINFPMKIKLEDARKDLDDAKTVAEKNKLHVNSIVRPNTILELEYRKLVKQAHIVHISREIFTIQKYVFSFSNFHNSALSKYHKVIKLHFHLFKFSNFVIFKFSHLALEDFDGS